MPVRKTAWAVVIVIAIATGAGCRKEGDTVAPDLGPIPEDCNPALDCNDMFESSTVRDHSGQAGSFAALSEGCPYEPDEVPPLESLGDARIPQFDRSRGRASNMDRGNESLQDIDLHAHMMGVQGMIFSCIDLIDCYEDTDELGGDGDLDFDFELHPDGRVRAVSVKPSPSFDHPSVVACARKAVFEYRFPSYDGGQMMVNYTMSIEEVDGE